MLSQWLVSRNSDAYILDEDDGRGKSAALYFDVSETIASGRKDDHAAPARDAKVLNQGTVRALSRLTFVPSVRTELTSCAVAMRVAHACSEALVER